MVERLDLVIFFGESSSSINSLSHNLVSSSSSSEDEYESNSDGTGLLILGNICRRKTVGRDFSLDEGVVIVRDLGTIGLLVIGALIRGCGTGVFISVLLLVFFTDCSFCVDAEKLGRGLDGIEGLGREGLGRVLMVGI